MSAERVAEARPLIDKALLEDSINPKLLLYKGTIIQNQIELSTPSDDKKLILDSAYYFYTKAVEFDLHKLLTSVLAENLQSVAQQYSFTGMEQFNEAKYTSALSIFEKAIGISDFSFINHLDTMLWYNAAITADKLQMYTKSEYYYSLIIKYNPTDWNSVVALANTYKIQGEKQNYLSVIKTVNKENPSILLFYNEIIGYYLENQQHDSALVYLDLLINRDELNDQLFYLKGSILQEMGEIEQSNIQYKRSLEINPNNIDANYNLAANKYNQAIDILIQKKVKKKDRSLIDQYLKESLVYLETVKKQEPDNKYVLSMLMTCYQELNMHEEEEKLKKYIQTLK